MKPKKRYKHLFAALLVAALSCLTVPAASAQSTVNMINGDSIVLDACSSGSGVIYDDGGLMGSYSNNFDGYVLIQATAGMTITGISGVDSSSTDSTSSPMIPLTQELITITAPGFSRMV